MTGSKGELSSLTFQEPRKSHIVVYICLRRNFAKFKYQRTLLYYMKIELNSK